MGIVDLPQIVVSIRETLHNSRHEVKYRSFFHFSCYNNFSRSEAEDLTRSDTEEGRQRRSNIFKPLEPPFPGANKKEVFKLERFYIVNIIINNREKAYRQVNELLHDFAEDIRLRVGYPLPEENAAIILLVVKANNDVLGSLTGKLGQLESVQVKTLPLK